MGDKLVRDRIPEIMRAAGLAPRFRTLNSDERLTWLIAKLREETDELAEEPNLEECADVLEVVLAIARELGHTNEQLQLAAAEKAERRGAFALGLVLEKDGGTDDQDQ